MTDMVKSFHGAGRFWGGALMISIALVFWKSDTVVGKETEAKNLVKNPSFESGTDSWEVRENIYIDSLASDGEHSVAIKGIAPPRRFCLWQTIGGVDPVKLRGKELVLRAKVYIGEGKGSVEIKVRQQTVEEERIDDRPFVGMNNSDKENQILIIEWRDGRGIYRTVEERPGEWTSLESKWIVSADMASMGVQIWAEGSEAVVHVDDIFLGEEVLPILQIPLSRKIYYLSEENIQFTAQLNLQDERPEDFQLIVKLGEKQESYQFSSKKIDFSFPLKGLSEGEFTMECTLIDREKVTRSSLTFPIKRMEGPF